MAHLLEWGIKTTKNFRCNFTSMLMSKTTRINALTAASTLAGDSSLGSASIEITLTMIVSTVWMGSHLSEADS